MTEKDGTLEIPMGMAQTMAEYPEAMEAFCSLSPEKRACLISKARAIGSREEMAALVQDISKMG